MKVRIILWVLSQEQVLNAKIFKINCKGCKTCKFYKTAIKTLYFELNSRHY
jgi:hypothetical protein